MDVAQELDQLRDWITGCELAMFTDIGSRMSLCVAADSAPAQEDIDRISVSAEAALNGPVAVDALPLTGGDQIDLAVTMSPADVRLILRSTASRDEALVLVCQPGVEMAATIAAARDTLARIAAGSA